MNNQKVTQLSAELRSFIDKLDTIHAEFCEEGSGEKALIRTFYLSAKFAGF